MFPAARTRRLRSSPGLRSMVRETSLRAEDLMLPLFVDERCDAVRPIGCLPGVEAYPLDHLPRLSDELESEGVRTVMVFGVPRRKDAEGSGAWSEDGVAQSAVRALKSAGGLNVIADVCLCEYSDHGHCGVVRDGRVDNDSTLPLLGRTAASLADEGADIVAPSGMMDGSVAAIRQALDAGGHRMTPIMSYAVKYDSALYGPFREAACSAPAFGDRSGYQMDVGNRREALREASLDIGEGADIVMVKPALTSLDVISDCRRALDVPIAAYQVSGEYAMIMAAASMGAIDEERSMLETLTAIKRSGAGVIASYYTRRIVAELEVTQ